MATHMTRTRLFWWMVYATAFGLTEAALVAYVRRFLGWEPGHGG